MLLSLSLSLFYGSGVTILQPHPFSQAPPPQQSYRRWKLICIDFQCKFTDGFGWNFTDAESL